MKDCFIKGLFFPILLFLLPMAGKAQDGTSLGKITVYEFRLDSLSAMNGNKYLYAIGTEHEAELFVTDVANNVFFKIKINNEFYAVTNNPYGEKVSSRDYSSAGFFRADKKWETLNNLTHKAGPFFLRLPEPGQSVQASNTSQNTARQSTSTITKSEETRTQLQWKLMGKVTVTSDIRIVDNYKDVHYDQEKAFLYSAFDGKQEKYKLSVPSKGTEYEVTRNTNYSGAKIQWSHNGKYVWSVPSLSEMYTHRAGYYYYFNLSDVDM